MNEAPESVKAIINEFKDETKNELWGSEKDLVEFYRDENNYKLLKEGKRGGNLIFKYKSKSLTEAKAGWIDFISQQLVKYIKNNFQDINLDKLESEVYEIKTFITLKLESLLQHNSSLEIIKHDFQYDMIRWIDELGAKKLSEFALKNKKSYSFEYTQEQVNNRNDYFKRYGKDINALSKIVTRISNLESQFRKIKNPNDKKPRDIYQKSEELFTKYALSN